MKKLLLCLMLMMTCLTFAQNPEEVVAVNDTFLSTLLSVFVPAILASALVLFADAKKWFMTKEWSWSYFFASKLRPFLYTTIGGVILYVLLTLIPATKPFIEILAGSPLTELTAGALFAAATAIVDGFTKKVIED
jgi:hypothetical protein